MFARKSIIVIIFVLFSMISFGNALAETAVTIRVTTNQGVETIDLIVPHRPLNSMPLKVGDFVFFQVINPPPNLVGIKEGIITKIYDTQDETAKKAIILDHVLLE